MPSLGSMPSQQAEHMSLNTENLSLAYDAHLIVEELSLEIPQGRITALVGPNGSGKSTILKGMSRILSPRGGAVYLDGQDIHRILPKELAKRLAILPQATNAPEGLTVRDLVTHGRSPYQGVLGRLTKEDQSKVNWAMEMTETSDLANQLLSSLSGGQSQRAWIAMALAQDAEYLLLDEPTTYLDVSHQLEVMELLTNLNRESGKTVVMVLHDLNQAARYAHHFVVIADGSPVAQGKPSQTLTPRILKDVFRVDAEVLADPRTGTPMCVVYPEA